MPECRTMIEMIKRGGEAAQRGMEMLYNDKDLRKHAWHFHKRYSRYAEAHTWEDLHTEAFVRIVVEIEEGRGPTSGNCWGYFRNVCRNICEEFIRDDNKNIDLIQTLVDLNKTAANTMYRDGIDHCLKMLGGRWECLLRFYYLTEPPVRDYQELADILRDEGFGDFKPTAMHAQLHQCRQRLKKVITDNPNYFNL